MGWPAQPCQWAKLARAPRAKEHAMSQKLNSEVAIIGIDIDKNSFYLVGQDRRGALVLRQKWSRGQVEARLANLPASVGRSRAEKADKSSIGPSRISGPKESFLFVPPEVSDSPSSQKPRQPRLVALGLVPCGLVAEIAGRGEERRRLDNPSG